MSCFLVTVLVGGREVVVVLAWEVLGLVLGPPLGGEQVLGLPLLHLLLQEGLSLRCQMGAAVQLLQEGAGVRMTVTKNRYKDAVLPACR